MSGPAQRNLTLTEELEKLEQSITLTLQGARTDLQYTPFMIAQKKANNMNFQKLIAISPELTGSSLPASYQSSSSTQNTRKMSGKEPK